MVYEVQEVLDGFKVWVTGSPYRGLWYEIQCELQEVLQKVLEDLIGSSGIKDCDKENGPKIIYNNTCKINIL